VESARTGSTPGWQRQNAALSALMVVENVESQCSGGARKGWIGSRWLKWTQVCVVCVKTAGVDDDRSGVLHDDHQELSISCVGRLEDDNMRRPRSWALAIRSMTSIGSEDKGHRVWQPGAGCCGDAMAPRRSRQRSSEAAHLGLAKSRTGGCGPGPWAGHG
jgi:hypothetical protein